MAAAVPVESTDIDNRSAQQPQQLPTAPKGPTGPATTGSEPTAGAASGAAFDGQWQYYCSATTAQRGIFTTDQIKMPCNTTGGSRRVET
ncbi:hypothetical protein ACFWP7_06625 [Streptomyces sp. NPDC058470]|uniref:hypothetical protein n=1 Tax=Streptomyces sp. NPDC058470 TaxID=3346515 RepID=UPI0036699CFD